MSDETGDDVAVSVVVPAHNEGRGIERLLTRLGAAEWLEVLVVCNGCTDNTADVARRFPVTVIEITEPSKAQALEVGDAAAAHAIRAYIDADIDIDAAAVQSCARRLGGGVMVSSPARDLRLARSSPIVRWYYDVWVRLPQVRDGVFGRGVIVLSAGGVERIRGLPRMMSDDLVVSEAFALDERAVVEEARAGIEAPRTVKDLLRRRIRVATGNVQADAAGLRTSSARTSFQDLIALASREPRLVGKVIVFVAVTLVARVGARRRIKSGDYVTWLRDESSRQH